ncbi:MAG: hypothetical protein ACI9R3_001126 [Verrucomicrobiales bacterium]|jgi:hypothetical protein
MALIVAHVLLVIPYTTGAMAWGYANGLVPVRPAFLMVAAGGINLMLVFRRKPDLTIVSGLILALLLMRVFEVGILFRYPHPDGRLSQLISIAAMLFMVGSIVATSGVLYRISKIPILIVAAATVCICSLVNVAEWAGFVSMSTVPGRSAGFLEDANNSAIAIAMMTAVFITLSERFSLNCVILGIGATGVMLTLSRSGFLIYGLICVAFVLGNLRQHAHRFALMGFGCAAVAGLIAVVGSTSFFPESGGGYKKNRNVEQRMAAIFQGDVRKMGSSERMKDLKDGLAAVGEAPVFGMGMGAGTKLYQPHNQIISIWIDLGLIGVGLFVAIVSALAVSSVLSGFRAFYCVIPLVGFIPFSQFLVHFTPYWYGAIVASFVLASRVWSLRASRATQQEQISPQPSLLAS